MTKVFTSSQEKYFGENASTMGKLAGEAKSAHAYANPAYDGAVVLGRFQPLHLGHIDLIKHALKISKKVLVLVGSAFDPNSMKNPFTFEMRKGMVAREFAKEISTGKLIIDGLEDFTYRDDTWNTEFNKVIQKHLSGKVAWVTFGKDASTRRYIEGSKLYVDKVFHTPSNPNINATHIRNAYYGGSPVSVIPHITSDVKVFLDSYRLTEEYKKYVDEHFAVIDYHESWAASPFPPVFVAVDGLIVWHDAWEKPHFLVIKRKSEFGNGKLALPGGYLEVEETILESAKREVLEETGLDVSKGWSLCHVDTIDDPGRSARGRMITHVHNWVRSGDKFKPVLTAGDDAAEAFWLPGDEIYANKMNFFSDHYYVIAKFYPEVEDFRV
jgi:bifunctional NMN adenylyltransferase/nudix hydrolase